VALTPTTAAHRAARHPHLRRCAPCDVASGYASVTRLAGAAPHHALHDRGCHQNHSRLIGGPC
jgi:hypothetical protein